jgi:hypothetical protein
MTTKIRNLIVYGVAVALLVTYVLAPGGVVSAEYSKSRQQSTTQANACGNGDFPNTPYALTEDVFCSNTGSQIQGDENAAGLSSSQR